MTAGVALKAAAIAMLGWGVGVVGCTAQPRDGKGPMDQLKKRLYSIDQDTSALALAELIKLGARSTAVLLEALTHDSPQTRLLAAEGLGEIGDPSAANALAEATKDPNDQVRARAAASLHALGDSRGLPALVSTIDDFPDLLHSPYTASMYPLMQAGRSVLPFVVPLLTASEELTRQRAFLVLRAVVSQLPEGSNWEGLWKSLGSYDPAGPAELRDKAARRWRDWVARR